MSTLFTPQSTKHLPGSLTSLESSQANTIMLGSRRSSSTVMQQQSGMYAAPSRCPYRIKARPKTALEPTPHPSCQQLHGWTSHSLLQSTKLIRRDVLQTASKCMQTPKMSQPQISPRNRLIARGSMRRWQKSSAELAVGWNGVCDGSPGQHLE